MALQLRLGILSVRRARPCPDHPAYLVADGTNIAIATRLKYSRSAGSEVKSEMDRTAKSGRGGKGKSRKQAIAIGLSKARQKGKKVPAKKK